MLGAGKGRRLVSARTELSHCSDNLSDHLAGGTGSQAMTIDDDAQGRPLDRDYLFKPEPHMPVPNDGLGSAVTGPIYLLLFPRQPY